MTKNLLNGKTSIKNSAGISPVSRGIQRERAVELAVNDGRTAQNVLKADWEQAKRELSDESSNERNLSMTATDGSDAEGKRYLLAVKRAQPTATCKWPKKENNHENNHHQGPCKAHPTPNWLAPSYI